MNQAEARRRWERDRKRRYRDRLGISRAAKAARSEKWLVLCELDGRCSRCRRKRKDLLPALKPDNSRTLEPVC